jgi:hypothetical protein
MVSPWAARTGVTVFNIYLCPVMKTVGRGVPVNQEQRIFLNVVAPLPENREQTIGSFCIVLHETVRQVTDGVLESGKPPAGIQLDVLRENAAFQASREYLKIRYPQSYLAYLRFFLNLPESAASSTASLETEFEKAYPVPETLKKILEELVRSL